MAGGRSFFEFSVFPLGIWAFAVLFLLTFRPWRSFTYWRILLTALVLVLASVGVMAFFPFPPNIAMETAWGGVPSYYISFAPFDLSDDDLYPAALLIGEARCVMLLVIAVAISASPMFMRKASTLVRIPPLSIGAQFRRNPVHLSAVNEQSAPTAPRTKRRSSSKIRETSRAVSSRWVLPPTPKSDTAPVFSSVSDEEARTTRDLIEQTLLNHGIEVKTGSVFPGPAVTMYGLTPGWRSTAAGRKSRVTVDSITSRERDLALALKSPHIRFETVLPDEAQVGLEVPNKKRTFVNMQSVLSSGEWRSFEKSAALPAALGIANEGKPVFIDMAKMPHTIVAGATGSGKSVCINALIACTLLSKDPSQVRMVMIDPKRVELAPYRDIRHLYTPVVVDTDKAVSVLAALVKEMDTRLEMMEKVGARNIISYNKKNKTEPMPYLLVIIDEMADLMIRARDKVERAVVRLAQLGRAPGIHLVIATQRPSVDVITGIIKANFPTRIAFTVRSNVDSRTVLDSGGAEKLIGNGDMLYFPSDAMKPQRVQGVFVSDAEIEGLVGFWREAGSGIELPLLTIEEDSEDRTPERHDAANSPADPLLEESAELIANMKTISVSYLQRRFGIGFPRAGRLMDQLEAKGIVSPAAPGKPRRVIKTTSEE